jgi:hypothetical protein
MVMIGLWVKGSPESRETAMTFHRRLLSAIHDQKVLSAGRYPDATVAKVIILPVPMVRLSNNTPHQHRQVMANGDVPKHLPTTHIRPPHSQAREYL